MRILGSNRYRVLIYAILFFAVSSVTFFWLDSRDKGVNAYRNIPMSRETQIITARYKIKRLEDRLQDLRSGDYKQRMQGLGRSGLYLSDEMIAEEISETEENLQQARKLLARLLRK